MATSGFVRLWAIPVRKRADLDVPPRALTCNVCRQAFQTIGGLFLQIDKIYVETDANLQSYRKASLTPPQMSFPTIAIVPVVGQGPQGRKQEEAG